MPDYSQDAPIADGTIWTDGCDRHDLFLWTEGIVQINLNDGEGTQLEKRYNLLSEARNEWNRLNGTHQNVTDLLKQGYVEAEW